MVRVRVEVRRGRLFEVIRVRVKVRVRVAIDSQHGSVSLELGIEVIDTERSEPGKGRIE
jgi:hypothetical protein